MARIFTGSGTNYLATSVTAYDSGPWTIFGWVRKDGATGGGFGKVVHLDTGSDVHGQDMAEGVGGALGIKQPFATQPMEYGANVWSASWQFYVGTYDGVSQPPDDDGGTSNDQCALFVGDASTSMAQVDTAQLDINSGTGARTTGLTALKVGNRTDGSRAWNGPVFCVGMVPYMMDITTAEALRTGDMTALLAFDDPIYLFGLEGSDLTSHAGYGPSLTLSVTGTVNTETDPITLTWDVADHDIYGSLAKQTNKILGGGSTPTGALGKATNRQVAGSITPAGAPAKQTARRLVGSA